MAFSKFPDINPNINITYQEAVNLLITSIALEEISLSELIDAEKNKLLYILNDYKHENADINNIVDINKSVNNTIQNMTNLHVVLQNNIESIKDILPAAEDKKAVLTEETNNAPNINASEKNFDICIKGKGKGTVSNQQDEFYLQAFFMQVSLQKSNVKNRSIYYTVQNNGSSIRLIATGYDINMENPSSFSKSRIIIYGKGHIEKSSKHTQNISNDAKFFLTINENKDEKMKIKMQITTETDSKLIHNSGIVELSDASDLHIEHGESGEYESSF